MNKLSAENQQKTTILDASIMPSTMAYAIVRNIPKTYHSKHLRYFFSDYVENGRFHCFHYRHRPEVHLHSDSDEPSTSKEYKRFCCVVAFKDEEQRAAFIKQYHLKFWMNEEGQQIPLRCFIFPLKPSETTENGSGTSKDLDFRSLIELKPPSLMPHGNVGTPTIFFLEQIRLCKLPPSILPKLGIKAKKRVGKYGAVNLNYNGSQEITIESGDASIENESFALRGSDLCASDEVVDNKIEPTSDGNDNDDDDDDDDGGADDNDEQCEEWERHEALHDDVTEQERTKPKKYEEEQEVTWEKGGPGLVWYTDTFFWNELEEGTDSDWKWADDWDVDYSVYYDRKDGDMDARQAVEILEDQKLRSGEVNQSIFKKKEIRKRHREIIERPSSAVDFGHFEAYTKGVGSKIMKRYGWSPGIGLGAQNSGRLETVSMELEEAGGAQTGSERKGLGYHGEKLQRTGFIKRNIHTIATKYDDEQNVVNDDDTMSKVLRREEPNYMKYR